MAIENIEVGDKLSVLDASCIGNVTQTFRNITTEWLEVVWSHPVTGTVKQIISTRGHWFLKPGGSYDRIIDMADRSAVADVANDNQDGGDISFGRAHRMDGGIFAAFFCGPSFAATIRLMRLLKVKSRYLIMG